MKESSKTEGKLVSIKFEQIMDLELKVKYVTEAYGQRINNNEILNSDVWAMIIVETDELCSLITAMKRNIWNDPCKEAIKITHMHTDEKLWGSDTFLKFYLHIEKYYVNNGVNSINVSIPKVKGVTMMINFLKKAGFRKIAKEYSYTVSKGKPTETKEPTTLLMKTNLETWYEKIDGKYCTIMVSGKNGMYKPVTKKEADKIKTEKAVY